MAIDKTININVNSKDAVQDITLLNSILEEQEQITIELQREQQKLEQQLRDTPKNSLAAQRELTTELNHVKDSIKDQNLSVKQLKVQQKSLGKGTKDLTSDLVSNGGAMGILNNLTGGLAQQFKDSYEAISLSSKGLSGFKKAMLATGIGAFVIALGYVISNFDKIKDLVSGVSAELKDLLASQEKNVQASRDQFDAISMTENTLKLQGKSEKDILAMKKAQTNETITLLEAQLLTQQETRKSQIETAKRNKDILQGIIRFVTAPLSLILKMIDGITYAASFLPGVGAVATNLEEKFSGGIAGLVFDPSEVEEKADATIAETKKQLDKLRNRRDGYLLDKKEKSKKNGEDEVEEAKKLEDLKNKIRDESANKEDEARKLELLKIEEHNEKLLKEAKDAGLLTQELKDSLNEKLAAKQAEFDAIDKERRDKKKAAEDAKKEKEDADERERLKIQKEFEEEQYRTGFDNLQNILSIGGKKMEKVGKALAIADVVRTASKSISSTISSTAEANAKAVAASPLTSGMPFVGINTAKAALSIGSTVASAAKSINSIKGDSKSVSGGGGAAGGGGGGGGSQPPAFNIVGASDTNQLADAIGTQEQQPVQAFVVANDVTTAQSLQNNIVEGATIG